MWAFSRSTTSVVPFSLWYQEVSGTNNLMVPQTEWCQEVTLQTSVDCNRGLAILTASHDRGSYSMLLLFVVESVIGLLLLLWGREDVRDMFWEVQGEECN